MSMVYITEHNESIYNVTKKPEGHTETKEPIYKSCNTIRIKTERKHPKLFKEKGTMGPPQILPPEPTEFLRKRTGKPPMLHPKLMDPDYGKSHACSGPRRPPVPLTFEVIKEQDEKLKHPPKNFITRNVKAAVTMKPKSPRRRVVVDVSGTEKPLGPGLEPEYIYSRVFGKIPTYLDKLIRIKERHEQVKRDLANEVQPKCRYITSEERQKLLLGLKQNWEELQTQYQGLPLMTDTIPKINRKSKLEAALKQLEKDIVLVERHPYIYVYNDADELCV